jgi:Calcineurin-like phosphoesterase
MATVGISRLIWRRFISIPTAVKDAYKLETGKKFGLRAVRKSAELAGWRAGGTAEALSNTDKESNAVFATANAAAIEAWAGKLVNLEKDYNVLKSQTDCILINITIKNKSDAVELIRSLNKPAEGVFAYRQNGKVIVIGKKETVIGALQRSSFHGEVGFTVVEKGDKRPLQQALQNSDPIDNLKLSDFAQKIKCIEYLKVLEAASLVKRGIISEEDFPSDQYIVLKGEEWRIECSILQDGLWDKIFSLDANKTGIYSIKSIDEAEKKGASLDLIYLKECVESFIGTYTKDLNTQIGRLQKLTDFYKTRYKRKLVNFKLKPGQSAIYVGDIHQNLHNLEAIFDKYEKELASGKLVLVFLGDYVHESGAYSGVNMRSITQSLETMDYLTAKLERYPDGILIQRGNHDFAQPAEINIIKDGIKQLEIFLSATEYVRGNKYLTALHNFFEALPWAAITTSESCRHLFSAHSFTNSPKQAQEIANLASQMLGVQNAQAPELSSVQLLSGVTKFISEHKVNMDHLLIGRDYLDNPQLAAIFMAQIPNLSFMALGHTFLRDRFGNEDETTNDADCHRFLATKSHFGYVMQSFLGNLRVLELTAQGQLKMHWVQTEAQYFDHLDSLGG